MNTKSRKNFILSTILGSLLIGVVFLVVIDIIMLIITLEMPKVVGAIILLGTGAVMTISLYKILEKYMVVRDEEEEEP